eukprot:4750338-Lingulodinium_polyedra.AAC.1
MMRSNRPFAVAKRTPRTLHANTETGVRVECVKRAISGGVFGCCLDAARVLLRRCFGAAWVAALVVL